MKLNREVGTRSELLCAHLLCARMRECVRIISCGEIVDAIGSKLNGFAPQRCLFVVPNELLNLSLLFRCMYLRLVPLSETNCLESISDRIVLSNLVWCITRLRLCWKGQGSRSKEKDVERSVQKSQQGSAITRKSIHELIIAMCLECVLISQGRYLIRHKRSVFACEYTSYSFLEL